MRKAVRAIIINDSKLLVMHRNKFGDEYETLPGGNIEVGETPEQALRREVTEETTINFDAPKLVYVEHAGVPYGDQYIFLCEYKDGEPRLSEDSQEFQINKLGQNLYEPKWVPLNELPDRPFLSEKLKQSILEAVRSNWPKTVVEIS